jgi:NodT family efflux transporter outer membrane factor (OMF) lipoprotein
MNPTMSLKAALSPALATLLSGLLLASCSTAPVGPQASGIQAPAGWNSLGQGDTALVTQATAKIEQRWWQSFGDPTLDRLIQGALAGNKNLAIAVARVEEAKANRSNARAQLMPQVEATADASRGNQGLATENDVINLREADLQASWEIDLFGKNQARAAQATALLQSEDARRQAAMVSLLAEVARNYFDLRNDQQQIEITVKNLATQQRTLDLIQVQFAGALSSQLDVQRASAQVSTTSALLPALRADYTVTLDRLNILLGVAPGTIDAWVGPAVPLKPLSPQILVAAPASVLASRPDIRAAERNFAASVSAAKVAAKEIYPTVSLTALFGVQNATLFNTNPWTFGAGLTQPILNFGRIQSDIDLADAQQKEAFLNYQETVLEGLEDMEDALTLYLHETGRQHDLDLAAQQNRKAVDLATRQYTAGYTGLLDLLIAQQSELQAESSLAQSNATLRENLVHIYTAAGGGWDL